MPPTSPITWCARASPSCAAHESAGRLVRICLERGIRLEDLSLEEFKGMEPLIGEDIYGHLSLEAA